MASFTEISGAIGDFQFLSGFQLGEAEVWGVGAYSLSIPFRIPVQPRQTNLHREEELSIPFRIPAELRDNLKRLFPHSFQFLSGFQTGKWGRCGGGGRPGTFNSFPDSRNGWLVKGVPDKILDFQFLSGFQGSYGNNYAAPRVSPFNSFPDSRHL